MRPRKLTGCVAFELLTTHCFWFNNGSWKSAASNVSVHLLTLHLDHQHNLGHRAFPGHSFRRAQLWLAPRVVPVSVAIRPPDLVPWEPQTWVALRLPILWQILFACRSRNGSHATLYSTPPRLQGKTW